VARTGTTRGAVIRFLLKLAALLVVGFALGYLGFTVGAGPWIIPVIAIGMVLVPSLAAALLRRARGARSDPS